MIQNFDDEFDEALDGFSSYRLRAATGTKWGMQTQPVFRTSALLFLYLRAIENYDPAPGAFNFLTENQVNFILSQIRRLTGGTNGPVYS